MKSLQKKVFNISLGILYIVWFFIPVIIKENNGIISPFSLKTIYLKIIPLMGILRIIAAFTEDKILLLRKKRIYKNFLIFLETSIILYTILHPLSKYAYTSNCIKSIPLFIIIITLTFFAINIMSIILTVDSINKKNPEYNRLKSFNKNHNNANLLLRIKTKLIFSFIGIITFIVSVLSLQLLNNYKTTLMRAIADGANNQVQQTSTIYRINLGDSITLLDYIARQIELNNRASFKYESLSIYTNYKNKIYMGNAVEEFDEYTCEYSTLSPGIIDPEQPPLTPDEVSEYFILSNSNESILSIENENYIKFISPIIITDWIKKDNETIKKERFLGFTVIVFDTKIINRPFYTIRNLVFLLTVVFLYLSIILIYLVGNFIVNPILYLRMKVNEFSNKLDEMIHGRSRISSNALSYNDNIRSRDEVGYLSNEINNMVNVIKGIIPYISASTLKNSNKPEPLSIEKDITFLFTDIRGFTNLCEGMSPNEVVKLLNSYLNLETEIIINNHGDIDKFVGDAVMAFFQGPDKELNACRAAFQLRCAMLDERDLREQEGLPTVDIGIGINTGKVVFGSVGAKDRMDFTSIGDNVNLASRLEGANKAYGSKTIISEYVYFKVKNDFLCRELDFITVKGKNRPVRIYEIIQEMSKVTPKLLEIKSNFENGLYAYREKKWNEALCFFKKNSVLYKDKTADIFIHRVEHFVSNPPPEDWDGIFSMDFK